MFRALCCCLDDDDDVADDAPRERDANDRRRRDRDARVGALADENRVGTTTTADGSLRAMILDGNDDGDGDTDDEDDEDGGRLLPHASRRSDGAFFGDGGENEREWEARRVRAAALERSESAPPRGKLTRSDGDFVGENGKEEAMRRWMSETERRMERHRRAASVGFAVGGAARDGTGTKRDFLRTASQRSETVDYDNSCPTCFEAYEEENPRITLACGHHFHLACILSWQEYSAATSRERGCPACDAPIDFNEM